MRSLRTNKIFVSVHRAERAPDYNHRLHVQAFETLRATGAAFTIVRGFYRGQVEDTFMLVAETAAEHGKNLQLGIELARMAGQESILEVTNDDAAFLHRLDSGYTVDRVGTFREVTKAEALQRNAYTCDALTGRYFVTE